MNSDIIVLSVEPKDIHVTFSIPLRRIEQILDYLDNSTCKYNSEEEPALKEADEYVKRIFFETMNQLTERIKQERGL